MQPMPWEMPGSIDFDTIPDLKPKLFGGYRQDGTQEIDEVFSYIISITAVLSSNIYKPTVCI